ncbi:hypothetical protein [Nannocystis exedens]|uniref:hypothetical protein n=1 Tax=Nannocystis exedens TaxID=54 RepID=UPI000BB9FFE7|nr:hypothetical protein [Nannocystis exedens]PCC66450.1 hypothetical protein NAEX_09038 [Nannocystis exedens]
MQASDAVLFQSARTAAMFASAAEALLKFSPRVAHSERRGPLGPVRMLVRLGLGRKGPQDPVHALEVYRAATDVFGECPTCCAWPGADHGAPGDGRVPRCARGLFLGPWCGVELAAVAQAQLAFGDVADLAVAEKLTSSRLLSHVESLQRFAALPRTRFDFVVRPGPDFLSAHPLALCPRCAGAPWRVTADRLTCALCNGFPVDDPDLAVRLLDEVEPDMLALAGNGCEVRFRDRVPQPQLAQPQLDEGELA